mgnify:FL=1
MTKPIYNYDPQTGVFVAEMLADESPLEPGVFLIPANATDVPPPSQAHSWRDGNWIIVPPPVVDRAAALAAAKTNGLARISGFAKSKRGLIAGTSDDAEIAGWNNKLRIALAIGAGTATEADQYAFSTEIEARGLGETLEVFCAKVIRNAAFYGQTVGLIDGLKRRAQDAVAAASTPEEVDVALADMKFEAEATYDRLMATA